MAATNELYEAVDVLNLNANQQAETCSEAKKVVSTRIADHQRIIIRAVHFGQVEAFERVILTGVWNTRNGVMFSRRCLDPPYKSRK